MKNMLDPIELLGVPSVGPALKSSYHVIGFGENVYNFPFPLVTPLESK